MNQKIFKWWHLLLENPRKLFNYLLGRNISYSQLWEDLILSFFFQKKHHWFYVDVGSNHHKRLSNTHLFYKDWWNGINIEPNPILSKKLSTHRKRDINLNCGISDHEGVMDFYIIDPDTLSTFDKNAAQDYAEQWHKIVSIKPIKVTSLANIFAQYTKNISIDFLSVDTEWYDMHVLKSNDWTIYRPSFVILETLEYKKLWWWKKLTDEYKPFFETIGYSVIVDTYINTIYIDNTKKNEFGIV